MKRALLFGFSLTSLMLLTPATSWAKDSGFEFGARLAYGIPMGDATGDDNDGLKESISYQIPIWLDLGYRASPALFVGGYFSYGFGGVGDSVSETCDTDGVDCSIRVLRFGVQGQYHFMPGESTDGWAGLGVGYESMGVNISGGGEEVDLGIAGFEFLLLQGGVDFAVADAVALGPFLGLTLAQYSSTSCDGLAQLCDLNPGIDKKAMHEWLFIGVRGEFGAF